MSAPGSRYALRVSDELVQAIVGVVSDDVHGTRTEDICERLNEGPQRLGDALEFVKERGILLGFGGLWFFPDRYAEATERFLTKLGEAHEADPANGAVSPRSIASRAGLEWTGKGMARIVRDLVGAKRLRGDENGVRLPGFTSTLGSKQESTLARLVEVLESAEFRPPVGPGLAAASRFPSQAVRELLRVGEHAGLVVPMENEIWTTPEVLDRAHAALAAAARNKPEGERTLTIADARTALDASRRFAHAFLMRLADDGRAEGDEGEWEILEA